MHTQNLQQDSRASLLITQPDVSGDPLGAGRLTLLGTVTEAPAAEVRDLYLSRYENAKHRQDYRSSRQSRKASPGPRPEPSSVCSDQALAAYSPTSPRGTAPDALLSIGSSLSSIDAQGVSWRFWQFVPVPQRFLPLALRACTHGHTPAFNNVLLRSRYDALIFLDTAALAMPDTVVRWQRERFRRFWAGLSKLPCRT